jgi:hypothetical protein
VIGELKLGWEDRENERGMEEREEIGWGNSYAEEGEGMGERGGRVWISSSEGAIGQSSGAKQPYSPDIVRLCAESNDTYLIPSHYILAVMKKRDN